MRMRLAAGTVAVAFVLSGCAKIPIVTQWKLRSYRIETADLRSLRVAVRAPSWIVPTPDNGKVVMSYWGDGDEKSRRTVTVRLKRANYAEDKEALTELAGSRPIAVYEIDPRDLSAATSAQEEARLGKQKNSGQTRAEVTVDRAGCRTGEIPSGPIALDLYVHTDDATGWLLLFNDYDLRPDAAHEAEFLNKFAQHVPLCGKLANRLQ
jgi:hypothetical protein